MATRQYANEQPYRTHASLARERMAQAEAAQRRYRLPDIILTGRPVSENRAKVKYRVTRRDGRQTMGSAFTPEADAWITQAALMARQAVQARGAGVPHPRDWPRPLRFDVYLRDGRLDLDNPLKRTIDGVKMGLDVDDRHYCYGRIEREDGPQGMRLVVASAPLLAQATPRATRQTTRRAGRTTTGTLPRAPRPVSPVTRPRPTKEARMH